MLLLVLVLFSSSNASATRYSVHVGPNGYEPYSIVERNGGEVSYSGIMFDLLDGFEKANPEFERTHSLLTRKRANLKMANGEAVDLMFNSPLFVSDEIKNHYEFTDPLVTTKDVVITHKNSDLAYQSVADLFGKTVGAIRGYSYGKFDDLIRGGLINVVRVDHHTQAIGMLEKGRIDAYFGNIFVTPHYIKSLDLQVGDFVFSGKAMYEFEFSFAVNRKKPELYSKLNAYIADAKANGSLDRMIRKYLE